MISTCSRRSCRRGRAHARTGSLTKNTLALVLAGGRGSRLGGAHQLAREAVAAVRRQVPDHRFRAVELRELGDPPHRHLHAVQVAEPHPPRATRLELPRRSFRRVRRAPSGAAAHRDHAGTRARPTPSTRTSISCGGTIRQFVLILAGDHVYKMDYGRMLDDHVRSLRPDDDRVHRRAAPAEATRLSASSPSTRRVASTAFQEKPSRPTPVPSRADRALASMGIYVFDAAFLYDELVRDADDAPSGHDFGKDIIPRLLRRGRARMRS